MKPRISMITLGVNDLQRSIEFYETGLGFPRMEAPAEVAFFTLNGSWLGLYGRDALAEDARVEGASARVEKASRGFAGFSLAHNVSSEHEVDQVMAQAAAAGAVVTKSARKTEWGGYAGYFSDPDGYLWEIAHNPLFWVGPSDQPA